MIRKVAVNFAVAFCLSVFLTACWIVLLTQRAGRIISSWEQPKEIEYQRNTKYTLYVREKNPDWAPFWHRVPRHEILIGWSENYGHWLDCTFHAGTLDDDKIDEYIAKSTVEWTVDGVSLKQVAGHVVFFPKQTFIGGR